jgi:hypothetical protein
MFKKAVRSQAKLKLAITGPSGSGKTYSALRLARGIAPNGKIALIDTENNSASLYSDGFDFDSASIDPPYTIDKYITAIKTAEKAGYDVLIVDSLTHAWAGEGGLLQQKEQLDARGGNSYTNWAKMTPLQEKFIAALLHSKVHLIATIRSKQDYVLQENKSGKQAPVKVGLAPVQRDGLEYEFTAVLDVAMNHEAVASKDRTRLFDGKIMQLSEEHGTMLREWMESASPEQQAPQGEADKEEAAANPSNDEKPKGTGTGKIQPAVSPRVAMIASLIKLAKERKWVNADVTKFIVAAYGKAGTNEMSEDEIQDLMAAIKQFSPAEAMALMGDAKDAEVVNDPAN